MTKEEQVKRGFNAGYMLQREKPELTVEIAQGFKDPSHPFVQGFMAGSIECMVELKQDISKHVERLKQHQNSKQSPELDLEI